MGLAIGIDLGTTNSVVAVVQSGRARALEDKTGQHIHPSIVFFPEEGEPFAGLRAKERLIADPANTVYSAKRLIGRDINSEEMKHLIGELPYKVLPGPDNIPVVKVRDRAVSLPEISAMVLRHLKEMCEERIGEEVNQAIITVPANFNDVQRSSTKVAGRIAGFNVLRILNEPTAAALAYGFGGQLAEKIAVYDFGGGTFDITIVELEDEIFEVLSTAGDTYLGGDDFDNAVVVEMAKQFEKENGVRLTENRTAMQRIRSVAEKVKCQLSNIDEVQAVLKDIAKGPDGRALDFNFTMTRDRFEELIRPLVDRSLKVCDEALKLANLQVSDLDNLVMVGGTTRVPLVRKRVAEHFGIKPRTEINPDEVVAIGAAIQAFSLTGEQLTKELPKIQKRTAATRKITDMPLQPLSKKGTMMGVSSMARTALGGVQAKGGTARKQTLAIARGGVTANRPVVIGKTGIRTMEVKREEVVSGEDSMELDVKRPEEELGIAVKQPDQELGIAVKQPDQELGIAPKQSEENLQLDVKRSPQDLQVDVKRSPQDLQVDVKRRPEDMQVDVKRRPEDMQVDVKRRPEDMQVDVKRARDDRTAGGIPAVLGVPQFPVISLGPPETPGLPSGLTEVPAGPVNEEDVIEIDGESEILQVEADGESDAVVEEEEIAATALSGEDLVAVEPESDFGDGTAPTMDPESAMDFPELDPSALVSAEPEPEPRPDTTLTGIPHQNSSFGQLSDFGQLPSEPPPEIELPDDLGDMSMGMGDELPLQMEDEADTGPADDDAMGWTPNDEVMAAPGAKVRFSNAPPPDGETATSVAVPDMFEARAALLLDVTPRALGVGVAGGFCDIIIERNASIPVEQSRVFSTSTDNQTQVAVTVYQGESKRSAENTALGQILLTNVRAAPRGEIKIRVTFEIDTDGILGVSAVNEETGIAQTTRIELTGGMDEAQVEALVQKYSEKK